MDWRSVVAIVVGALLALFGHRFWLPSVLSVLRGSHIKGMWAGKEYSLAVSQAESVIQQQTSIIHDSRFGAVSLLKSIPGVRDVELAPRVRDGRPTGELAIRVTVTKKRPLHELPTNEVIPSSVGQVPTDVVEG
jgi:hypothetical protein